MIILKNITTYYKYINNIKINNYILKKKEQKKITLKIVKKFKLSLIIIINTIYIILLLITIIFILIKINTYFTVYSYHTINSKNKTIYNTTITNINTF